ncbi:class I SAM-dependent methyltransferase [Methanomicrobium antiquum]|uniref:Class I SAM-dependent methyltransferase n=1 Tax=Methanomicrobium antiquum TaxID=487686 RepID=A0AAF0JMU1_9EURY|nr:class I SAM-dependent methyltransferase [Methanomicrobium antiquum]WFN36776.1 class I SAM-dependent methyltransferase [Methanomicrobium antiquum]
MVDTESRLKTIESRIIANEQFMVDTESRLKTIESRIIANEQFMVDTESRLKSMDLKVDSLETQIIKLMADINLLNNLIIPDISIENSEFNIPVTDSFDYSNFEDMFRGSEQLIKKRQKIYLPLFKEKKIIVDLGSGRGEFLEILKEYGLDGMGVDFDDKMVTRCQKKGLNVKFGDIIEYLEGCLDESIDGIFSSQVIEHLTFEKMDRLIRIAFRKLKTDGIFVIETINPYNLLAFRLFYLDPSHQKPIFPEIVRFICCSSGFGHVKIRYLSEDIDLNDDSAVDSLNKWVNGDYAIIAKKGV